MILHIALPFCFSCSIRETCDETVLSLVITETCLDHLTQTTCLSHGQAPVGSWQPHWAQVWSEVFLSNCETRLILSCLRAGANS